MKDEEFERELEVEELILDKTEEIAEFMDNNYLNYSDISFMSGVSEYKVEEFMKGGDITFHDYLLIMTAIKKLQKGEQK
jgi:hypothetical protein